MADRVLQPVRKLRLPTAILDAVQADDKLYAATMQGVWELDLNSKKSRQLDEHDSYVSSIRLLNKQLLLSAGYDGKLQWYDLHQDKRVRSQQLHEFWSWDMSVSPDEQLAVSVTGQYKPGDYRYTPANGTEPGVVVVAANTGEVRHRWPMRPSVQAVAFSPDSQFVAAGNLMGDIRVWNVDNGELAAEWNTAAFTSWGIIKSHSYLGGIFAITFTPDGKELLVAGMGPMRDPMAGNGRQLWQKFAWQEEPPRLIAETHRDDAGEGLMECLTLHPDGRRFIMAGRLRGGKWNAALFDLENGRLIESLKTGCRITQACFSPDGSQLTLVGTQGQPRPKADGSHSAFGRVDLFKVAPTS